MVAAAWGIPGLLLIVGVVVGMPALRDRILRKQYRGPKGRARVCLTEAPRWMPESLAQLTQPVVRAGGLFEEQRPAIRFEGLP